MSNVSGDEAAINSTDMELVIHGDEKQYRHKYLNPWSLISPGAGEYTP
jgi:hypothetical protein